MVRLRDGEGHHAKLTLLYVLEGASQGTQTDPDRVKAGIRERLSAIVGNRAHGLDLNHRVEFGGVAPTILEVASQLKAELIVLGVRPSSGLRPLSVAGRLRVGAGGQLCRSSPSEESFRHTPLTAHS